MSMQIMVVEAYQWNLHFRGGSSSFQFEVQLGTPCHLDDIFPEEGTLRYWLVLKNYF
uniref:Uncharacterized protein n=1 Tax=Anguilla anguilla TaxID=7936 RepID=A0A0E9QIQ6_ANGAN